MAYDVISIGSAVYDMFVYTEKRQTEILSLRHPKEKAEHIAYPTGAKVLITQACFDIGGGATNTATCFSRLGLKAGCVSSVGRDLYGRQILDCLKREKVDFLGSISAEHTDFSIILDSRGHDRTVLTFKGASSGMKFSGIKHGRVKTGWLYVSSLLGSSYNAAERLAAYIKRRGGKVAFNPSTYLAEKGIHYLKKLLANTDVLVLNREESMLLTGMAKGSNIHGMLARLSSYGPSTVIITDGPKGAHACQKNKYYYICPHKDTKIVETAGAGDAFASSFIAGIIKKGDMEFALQLGVANAESVISYFGAHNRLLTWKDAVARIRKRPARIATGFLK
ncbi:carbohydrate kinase family protein [Candidatus Woesearchaeota archaeon]|nr:carbohydrate kinase family protein [Candidatus Woesearchaeota archaeon]